MLAPQCFLLHNTNSEHNNIAQTAVPVLPQWYSIIALTEGVLTDGSSSNTYCCNNNILKYAYI